MRQWIWSALVQIMACRLFGTSAGLLSIGHLGTNFSGILINIPNCSLTKMHMKMSSAKWRPFCLRGHELNTEYTLFSNNHNKSATKTPKTKRCYKVGWRHHRMSLRQLVVPPITSKLAWWPLSVTSEGRMEFNHITMLRPRNLFLVIRA